MYLLFIMYANCLANGLKDWKPAAAKAVNYLRKLPDDIRDSSLDFAYTRIAEWYEASGDPKAEWHRKQADSRPRSRGPRMRHNGADITVGCMPDIKGPGPQARVPFARPRAEEQRESGSARCRDYDASKKRNAVSRRAEKTAPVWPCEGLCAPMTGVAEVPVPPGGCGPDLGRCSRSLERELSPSWALCGGRKEKQDKRRGRRWRLRPVTSARSAGSYGGFGCIKSGVKNRRRVSRLWSQSPNSYCHNEKIGVTPRKGAVYGQKREICFLSHPREESHPGAPVSGGRKPEYDRFRRAGGGLLPGLPQRQRRRPFPANIYQWDSWRSGCPPSPSGRRWSRTWWPVSWRTPISSATRISAVDGRRACRT